MGTHARRAAAQTGGGIHERLTVRGELAAGSMLSRHQRTDLDFGVGLQSAIRLGISMPGPFALQLSASHWGFPRDGGWGRATLVGAGLRVEPELAPRLRAFVDGNAGLGLTGAHERFMFDVGIGVEWALTRWAAVGPALRYGQILTEATDVPADARFWSLGAVVTVRPGRLVPM